MKESKLNKDKRMNSFQKQMLEHEIACMTNGAIICEIRRTGYELDLIAEYIQLTEKYLNSLKTANFIEASEKEESARRRLVYLENEARLLGEKMQYLISAKQD